MSSIKGCGTNCNIIGNKFLSTYLRSKQSDLPLDPMIPFLINISYFIFRYLSSAINFYCSSLSFFCYHACNYSESPYIFYSNSDILITLSLIYFLPLKISFYFICNIFLDCKTSPSSLMRSIAT